MEHSESTGWVVDPDDPRAPPTEIWERMSEAERQAVIDALPSEFPVDKAKPPEGDWHVEAFTRSRSTLRRHNQGRRRKRRKLYIAGNMAVYYPGEPMFSPDIFAVLDVEDHFRNSWVVNAEGRGLDLAIELHWLGDRLKDAQRNVDRYAQLGISEYFYCDLKRRLLRGFRLPDADARSYQQLVPQGGRFYSQVLDLELGLEGRLLRFFEEGAPVLWTEEIIPRLESALDEALSAAQVETERAQAETERAQTEAERADEAERRLAEALAELERLRGERF